MGNECPRKPIGIRKSGSARYVKNLVYLLYIYYAIENASIEWWLIPWEI